MIPVGALLNLLPKALKLAAGVLAPGAANIVNNAAAILEGHKDNPELTKALAELQLETEKVDAGILASDNEVEKAEIATEHWWIWGARPFLLYCAGVGTLACIAALLFHVDVPVAPLADLMLPMWGHAGFYGYQRTREKLAR